MALLTVRLTDPTNTVQLPGGYLLLDDRQGQVDDTDTYVQDLFAADLIEIVSEDGESVQPTVAYDLYVGDVDPDQPGPWLRLAIHDGWIVGITTEGP